MIIEISVTLAILALIGACWIYWRRPPTRDPPVDAAVLEEWEHV